MLIITHIVCNMIPYPISFVPTIQWNTVFDYCNNNSHYSNRIKCLSYMTAHENRLDVNRTKRYIFSYSNSWYVKTFTYQYHPQHTQFCDLYKKCLPNKSTLFELPVVKLLINEGIFCYIWTCVHFFRCTNWYKTTSGCFNNKEGIHLVE